MGTAIVFSGCESEIERIKDFSSTADLPLVYATDFETTHIDSFKIQFYVKAPTLQIFEGTDKEPYKEFPDGILLIQYDHNQQVLSRITADYARQYEKENKWEAKNNVVAVNAQGDTLKTEQLTWDEKNGKIYSDKFVRIIRPDQVITGIGFDADQNFQNWRIKEPKGPIYIELNEEGNSEAPVDSLKPETGNDAKRPLQFRN